MLTWLAAALFHQLGDDEGMDAVLALFVDAAGNSRPRCFTPPPAVPSTTPERAASSPAKDYLIQRPGGAAISVNCVNRS